METYLLLDAAIFQEHCGVLLNDFSFLCISRRFEWPAGLQPGRQQQQWAGDQSRVMGAHTTPFLALCVCSCVRACVRVTTGCPQLQATGLAHNLHPDTSKARHLPHASSNQNPGSDRQFHWCSWPTFFFIQSLVHLFHNCAGSAVTLIQRSSENHPVHASHWPAPVCLICRELPWSQDEVMAGLQVRVWFPLCSWKPSYPPFLFFDTCSDRIIDSKLPSSNQ